MLKEKIEEFAIPQVSDLIVHGITNVLAKQNRESYDKQFHCLEPLLSQIMPIGILRKKGLSDDNEKGDINSVHHLIEHLLYVLKRNTYHGDEVLKRITFFIEELLKSLGIHEQIFGEVWNSLRRHEDLMLYSIEKYRDHFMHQFHVFISGYIIIHSVGIEYFQKLLNNAYKHKIKTNPKPEFTKMDVLRAWAFTSLFHDCGYAFEKLDFGIENFSEIVLGVKLKSHFYWDDAILNSSILSELERISAYFNTCPRISDHHSEFSLFRTLIKESMKKNDHGIISAIILLQKQKQDNLRKNKVILIDHLVAIAASAIAIHNSNVFKEISIQHGEKICLKMNPFAFLLAYCDHAQEWGRKKSALAYGCDAIPHLTALQANQKQVVTKLNYPSTEKGTSPEGKKIREIIGAAKEAFVSPSNLKFTISYNIRTTESISITFNDCNDCPFKI